MIKDDFSRLDDIETLRLVVAALRADVDILREALDTADAYLSGRLPPPAGRSRADTDERGLPPAQDAAA